ncbi:MAG TPA: HAD family hydrolase [Candidatus Acidoferrum sp.]|nr:HAD family hydrolase [Candidatus Acidoferrum sp.]
MTDAVLFDVDGTLVDSNDGHARAWVAAFAEAGYQIPFERVRPLIGMGSDRILPALVPGLSRDTEPGKTIAARRARIFLEREVDHVHPTRGARGLLEAVRRRGARVVVATSAKREELDVLLARGGVADLVDVATTSDDASSSKPAPDIVVTALEKAGVGPERALFVGDTRYDVEAAHRAKLPCVALLCGGSTRADLAEAEAIYSDPAELTGALDLPPFPWSSTVSTMS